VTLTRIGVAVVAIVAAVAASYALFRALDERSAPPIVIDDAAATQPIGVDVRGAVAAPGVYELPPGARVQDAIRAGGGLSPRADLSTINLARRLRDGEVVVIAAIPSGAGSPAPSSAAPLDAPGAGPQRQLNINTATASELEALPGIGPVTAARIVAFREQHGPYRAVDDLIHVQGISTKTIDDFRDLVTTHP
jgi:competence protein ComEA